MAGDEADNASDSDDSLLRAIAAAPPRRVPTATETPLTTGTKLGGFRIVAQLGAGGMGVVYRAEDEQLRREVALKVIAAANASTPTARRRFLREARAAAAVNHPNVATVFEVGEDGGHVFIAMEIVAGETLREKLLATADNRLPVEEALSIAKQVARGLARAHEKGIVHRDLKPENVIVGEIVKVLDFGLARVVDRGTSADSPSPEAASTATAENEIAGTPGYMSPEQATGGAIDARTDVFAFGVMLYEMLAGRRPFAANNLLATAIATARDPHEPLSKLRPDVSRDVERIVDRCLAKKPENRYANAKEVLAEIDAVLVTPMPASARSLSETRSPSAWSSRTIVVATTIGLAVVGLGVFIASRSGTTTPEAPGASAPPRASAPLSASASERTATATAAERASPTATPTESSTPSATPVARRAPPPTASPPAPRRRAPTTTSPSASASSSRAWRDPLGDQN